MAMANRAKVYTFAVLVMFPIIALLDFHTYIRWSTLSYGRFPCSQRRQACLPFTKTFSGKSG